MPRQVTFDANPGKLEEMVDSAISHALINKGGVLSNMVFNAVARTFKEGQLPLDYVGPSHHQPGSQLHRLLRPQRAWKFLSLQAR